MIFGVSAEIITIHGNAGVANSREEVEKMLTYEWKNTGTWAAAVAAGDADEPITLIASIDAAGVIFWDSDIPASA